MAFGRRPRNGFILFHFSICGDTGFSERFSAYCPALVAYNNLEGELLILGFCTLTRITRGDFGPFASLISKGSS